MKKGIVATILILAGFGMFAPAFAAELFQARLSGANEVPPVATDTAGRFEALVSSDQIDAEYTLRVDSGVRVTQSHFHCGRAGANGPVIVFLAGFHAPGWDVDGKWVSNATITDANVVLGFLNPDQLRCPR